MDNTVDAGIIFNTVVDAVIKIEISMALFGLHIVFYLLSLQ